MFPVMIKYIQKNFRRYSGAGGDAALPFARAYRAGLADYPFFAVGKERENRRSGYCGEQKRILYRCRLRHR